MWKCEVLSAKYKQQDPTEDDVTFVRKCIQNVTNTIDGQGSTLELTYTCYISGYTNSFDYAQEFIIFI
jgi:hypothetical protein